MNKLKILILVVILFLSSMPLLASQPANATPRGIIYQAPITIDNTQSSATPSPFQQMIKIPISTFSSYIYDNNTSANFEFYYANNTIIPAWTESVNASAIVVWLKLYSIPASSSITIYIGFASKTTNLLSSSGTTGIGEAPQLSPTYGEYDDGAKVFPILYENFSGTSLPSGWTGSGYMINNGISIPYWSYAITTTKHGLNANQILDFYGNFPKATSGNNAGLGYTTDNSAVGSSGAIQVWIEINNAVWSNDYAGGLTDTSSGTYSATSAMATGTHVWSVYWPSSASASFYYDYSSVYTITSNVYSSQLPIGGANTQGSQATIGPFYWIRLRAYPPNGVMPSVSFGSVSKVIFQISFYQTSLLSGTEWGIRLNNSTEVWWLNTSGKYDNFTNLFDGNYYYQVINATGYYAPAYKGEITISNANVSQLITFEPGYSVSIKESGLPLGIKWWVNVSKQPGLVIGSISTSSTTRYNNFTEPNGSYSFSISDAEFYFYKPASNNTLQFAVSGSGLSLNVYFVKNITYSGTGSRSAYANASVSYYVTKQVTSSTVSLKYSATENSTYSTWNETDNNFWTFNSAGTKAWANTTNASGYYVYSGTKVWFNGTFPLSFYYNSKEHVNNYTIGILIVNFTIGETTYSWKHYYNYSVSVGSAYLPYYAYFDANITSSISGEISSITFYQTYYKYAWSNLAYNFYTINSASNAIIEANRNSAPTSKPTPISLGWSYQSITSSFSSLIVANITSFAIYWSAQYPTTATYNSNSYTASPVTGVLNAYSISFKANSDHYVLSYNISYYLVENYSIPASYIYNTFVYNYSILSQNSHQGQFWNSSAIYFNYTIPSDAYSSDPASYKILISNLTIPTLTANYVNFYIGYENFTYYSLTKYKNSYNITAYINVSSAKSVQFKFIMTMLINNYPSASYYKIEYTGMGSTEKLIINATTSFPDEALQISSINWGDGSPTVSSPIEYPTGTYYNFSISHQYSITGTFVITFLIISASGYASALSVSESTSITLSISIATTSNALPIKTDSYIYFNYSQVNMNLQAVKLYINNILAMTQNLSSNSNFNGSVTYSVAYYVSETAAFTAEWEYIGGGVAGNISIQYSVASSVPLTGKWVVLNYTLGTGPKATKESIPYFYTQQISFNVSWSYFVWQILLPNNAVNISVRGNPAWQSPIISVPATFNKTTATFSLLENVTSFQVEWLAPNPIYNSLIIIEYYPQTAIFGQFGINIPFNEFNTYLNGKQIYSPIQQVNYGEKIVINTTTAYGNLISSYTTTVLYQTQFIEIPLPIDALTIANLNSSYVIGLSVSKNGITQYGQYLMPLESVTYYVPSGTYNFTFSYINFNTYSIAKSFTVTMTISNVSYYLINGITLTNINLQIAKTQSNISNLVEHINISLANSNTKIYNETLIINALINNTNSSISRQIFNENNTVNNIYSKIQSINSAIYVIENNILSDINSSSLNTSTRINVIKKLLSLSLENENSSFSYKLVFGTPSVENENYSFPVFVYYFSGKLANYSVTQQAAYSLKLYYVSGNQTVPLRFSILSIKNGSFTLLIYNISPQMAKLISSNQAVIAAQGQVQAGAMTNIAAGVIGSAQIQYSPNYNLDSLTYLISILGSSQSYIVGRALTVIVAALALIYYSFRIQEARKKRRKK